MALLEVVTRCYRRPNMLAVNQASLQRLTSDNWTQTLLVDEVGIGVPAANARLADFTPTGDYVLVLDDDDECIEPKLLTILERLVVADREPPAFIMKMDHGQMGVLPDEPYWGVLPESGHIGCSAIVTRRDVWMKHRVAWSVGKYEADHSFIASVWGEHADRVCWVDLVATRVQRISRGDAE